MQIFVALICCVIVTTRAFSLAPIYKPRGCPATPDPLRSFCIPTPSECEVGRDSDCPNGLICCPGACGNFCEKELDFTLPQLPTNPAPIYKPRGCPATPDPLRSFCIPTPSECEVGRDSDCPNGLICCPGACGNFCEKELDFTLPQLPTNQDRPWRPYFPGFRFRK